MKLCWDTVPAAHFFPDCLRLLCHTWQSGVVTETMWAPKPKIATLWPITETGYWTVNSMRAETRSVLFTRLLLVPGPESHNRCLISIC